MPAALTVHYVFGMVVAAGAVGVAWWRWGRRMLLYALTLQILLGLWAAAAGMRPPLLHLAFAVLGWGGYMAANAVARRPRGENVSLAIALAASACVLVAFAIGQWYLKR